MTEVRLRARTVSEVVDAAFALYRRNAMQYILVTALAFSPLLLLQLLLPDAGTPTTANLGLGVLALAVGSWITYSLMSAVVVKLGSQVYLGVEPDLAQTVREVLPRLPAVMVAGLFKAILLLIGLILFFVGAFYVIARYFAVSTTVVLEGLGPISAFGRSSELSKGRKRFILNTLILVWIIYSILNFGVLTLAGIPKSAVITIVASSVFTIVAYPVIGLTEMLLYYDTRIQGEGFDIEQMAAALDAKPTAGEGTP
jgi:hypothetical protein